MRSWRGKTDASQRSCGEECRELIEVYARVRPTGAFPHLIEHSDVDGWYVPVDFERPAWVAGVGDTEPLWSVGSSQRLLAELDALNEHLGIPGDYGQLGGGEACSALVAGDPWATPKWVWCVLHWLARESVAQRLILKLPLRRFRPRSRRPSCSQSRVVGQVERGSTVDSG